MPTLPEKDLQDLNALGHLKDLEENEHHNFDVSCEALAEELEYFKDLDKLYASAYLPVPDEHKVPRELMRDAQNQFSQSLLTLMRGHLFRSEAITRKAIEDALYAYRMMHETDPQERMRRINVWIDRDKNDLKLFREDFGEKKILPASDPTLNLLRNAYERGSLGTHPSIFSHALWSRQEKNSYIWSYFDLPTYLSDIEQLAWIQRVLLTTFKTHVDILRVFYEAFGENQHAPKGWLLTLQSIESKLTARAEYLYEHIWKDN